MYTTQLATPNDIKEMAKLLQFLFEQEADFTPQLHLQEQGLKLIVDQPELGEIWILKENDKIVGMVSLLYTVSTALGKKVALMEDMVLHPDYRNKGLGSQLIEAAIDYAKLNGCGRITLLTDHDNFGAQKFYKSKGFKPSTMVPYRLVFE